MIDIIKESIDFYRNHFRLIFPVFFPVFFLEVLTTQTATLFLVPRYSSFFIQFLPGLLTFIFYSIYTASLIILFGSIISGNHPPPLNCIKKGITYLPFFIATELIAFVFTAAGFVLLIVPGIIIGVKLSLAQFYLILSDEMPLNAIKHSFKATDGLTSTIFSTVLMVSIPLLFLRLIFQLPLSGGNLTNPAYSMIVDLVFGCIAVIFPIIMFRFFCIAQQAESNQKNV